MTYPEIGNYGINPEDFESEKPHLKRFCRKGILGLSKQLEIKGEPRQFSLKTWNTRHTGNRHQGTYKDYYEPGGAIKGIISTGETSPESSGRRKSSHRRE